MSDTTTRGVRIEVESEYLKAKSSPAEREYLFAYRVRITNVGAETVQLLSRLWLITDALGDVERVEGPGVVGETPLLAPGGMFEYTSFCPLTTEVGTMEGYYVMALVATGERFQARIDPFTLAVPGAVN